jgi:glycosyltransferase involved in cell wall biosynthesis
MSYRGLTGYGGEAIERPVELIKSMECLTDVVAPVPFSPFPIRFFKKSWRDYAKVPKMEDCNGINVIHPRYLSIPVARGLAHIGPLMALACNGPIDDLVCRNHFDIVHAHFGYPEGYVGLRASLKLGVPLVVTIQATDVDVTAKISRRCRDSLKRVLERAALVIAPTDRLARVLRDDFGIKATIIYYGISEDTLQSYSERISDILPDKINMVSISMLIKSKGIDLNLEALKKLSSTLGKIYYLIIGDGPDRQRLEELTDSFGIRKWVKFAGSLPHAQAMEILSESDIFCMPSWQETFGLAYVEAMALGKPVIGCRGQGIDELIVRCGAGLLVEPKNADSIVRALTMLIDDESKRAKMGEQGKAYVLDHLTNRHTAENTLNAYRQVLNSF